MTRADLHRLVDELPEESVDPAGVLLTRAEDPVLAVLEAVPLTTSPTRATTERLPRRAGRPTSEARRST
jgi:hypothetical protein